MILTVTLNPCLHKFVKFRGALEGRLVLRPVETAFQGGGKGINAARIVSRFQGDVTALTFAGGAIGDLFEQVVRAEGIRLEVVRVRRPMRMSTMVFGIDCEQFREFLEAGSPVDDEECDRMRERFDALVESASIVTLNGSVPDPRLDSFFADATRRATALGKRVLVDTYGLAAPRAAGAKPFFLKANLDEIHDSFAIAVNSDAAVDEFAKRQLAAGVENLLITNGEEPARLYTKSGAYRVIPPRVKEINPVGSGDAMLGILALELDRGMSVLAAVKRATAAGSANAEKLEICAFSSARLDELERSVEIKPA